MRIHAHDDDQDDDHDDDEYDEDFDHHDDNETEQSAPNGSLRMSLPLADEHDEDLC